MQFLAGPYIVRCIMVFPSRLITMLSFSVYGRLKRLLGFSRRA